MTFSGTSRRRALKLGLVASLAAPAVARAETWPSGPVVFLNPFPAGGGTDAFCRPLAAQLGDQLGQQIIVDNRGGAGGTVYVAVAKAPRVDRMQEIWKDKAAEAGGEKPEQFARRIRFEIEKWQKVMAAADVRID
jgi:tripartite-type tricarboxylate transporter receptor subunit TctC